ncbi:protein-export chaperone SecB [Gudongella sp. DL1XJH-153]|uniref:protein-export chaperone SecB n=1 Tax=Gudongella sp. DL1XJH-153 TaxID=3409804 RepID=UPI003BB51352
MKEGIIKFQGYCVEEINYVRNNDFNENTNNVEMIPQFLIKVAVDKKNPYKYNIIIGTRLGFSDNENLPFRVSVVVRGFYEANEENIDEDELENIYLVNSSSILFPYLRSILTDATSKSDHEPVILPTINFYSIIEDINKEDLYLESNAYKEYI